ncbi:hypothetical protein VTL71DRAFT_8695 [Oculimacula yallundae]|uniref:Uncharacterized protein n=1 Tax=Oculimacula yallundae TaxID=86028 RepID=A0ABR4CYF5_9HELO
MAEETRDATEIHQPNRPPFSLVDIDWPTCWLPSRTQPTAHTSSNVNHLTPKYNSQQRDFVSHILYNDIRDTVPKTAAMPKPRKAEAARPAVAATIVGRVEDLQLNIQRVKSILGTFEGKVSNLEEEITKEVAEKEDAIRGHLNSTRENDNLYQQMENQKQAYVKTYNSLKEDHAELVADQRRVVLENQALKRQVAGLKGDTAQRDQLLKQIDENNGKILRLEEQAKNHVAELEHLQGAERKFIIELEKNAEKDQAIQKMKEEIEIWKRYQAKYDEAKKEIADLLKDEEAHLLRMVKMKEGNDSLEIVNKDLMSKAGQLVEVKEERQRLQKSIDDLKQQASENGADHEAVIKDNRSLKGQIQGLIDEHAASLAELVASQTAANEKIEALKTENIALKTTNHGSLAELQNVRASQEEAVEENKNLKAKLQHLEDLQGAVKDSQAKVLELEDERKLIEPLTTLGVAIRMGYLRYGQSRELLDKVVGPVVYAKNILADAALYQLNFLSQEGDGQLFLDCYGCPIFVSLDYGAMPKYCNMLALLPQFEYHKDSDSFTKLTLMPQWAEREQVIAGLQTVWNEVVVRAPMEFEGRADVDAMLMKLEKLTESLYLTLHYLIDEDNKDLQLM